MVAEQLHIQAALRGVQQGQEPPEWLLAQLRTVADVLVRFGNLPPALSPYGTWDSEAADEIFQGWVTERLLENGGFVSLLSRASSFASLRRLAQNNLRQWLANQAQRSQSQNLYRRLRVLLRDSDRFVLAHPAARPVDEFFQLVDTPQARPLAGSDRDLAALAWGLGEFELLRFVSGRNSPLLSTSELERFTAGLIQASVRALSIGQLMIALRMRFGLDDPVVGELEAAEDVVGPGNQAEATVLRDAAWAVIAELSARQADILLGQRADEKLRELAARHGCAISTIRNELDRIAQIILRHSADNDERDQLTTLAGDMLFELSS